jgi:lipopolysaccharide/colanic/teichoic acid biosynthesis glycosyltransferase
MSRLSKRSFDLAVAGLLLVALSPLLALIALLIKLTSRGPIFFIDERVGRSGQVFSMYKFRTMIPNAAAVGLGRAVKQNDDRITRIGRWLRAWSLDELPQLINILRGDMSIVGPRPAIPGQVALYGDFERLRLRVRPGVTGWAQVNGRNNLSWEQRIQYDNWYIDHWSWPLDLKILWRTVGVLLKREGLYGVDGVTPTFKGE